MTPWLSTSRRIASAAAALLGLLLPSCSYHGHVRSSELPVSMASPGSNAKATLSSQLNGIEDFSFRVDAVTFNYEIKPAFYEAARKTLESIFKDVDVGEERSADSSFFVIPFFDATLVSSGNGRATIDTVSRLDVYADRGGRLLRRYESSRQVHYSNPPGAMALGLLTGLTLFVLSPITIPPAIQIEGNHGRDLLEHAIRESFTSIGPELAGVVQFEEEGREVERCFQAVASDQSLGALSGQVALLDYRQQTLPMLASAATPTDDERVAIGRWDTLLTPCVARRDEFLTKWNTPSPIIALVAETQMATKNLRALLYGGGITYGEFARQRSEIGVAFANTLAKIEGELAKESAEAEARARMLAMEAQRVNLERIQTRQMEIQTVLMGVQTVNQAIAIGQQQRQHQERMSQQQRHHREQMSQQRWQHRELINEINQPRFTNCSLGFYSAQCVTW